MFTPKKLILDNIKNSLLNSTMSKKQLGQFYTTNYEYILSNMDIPNNVKTIVEPFVGNGDLLNFIKKDNYKLEIYRTHIDEIDTQLMKLLIERYNIVTQIGEYKKQNNIPVLDKSREQFIYDKINSLYSSETYRDFLKKIYESMMNETKKIQS